MVIKVTNKLNRFPGRKNTERLNLTALTYDEHIRIGQELKIVYQRLLDCEMYAQARQLARLRSHLDSKLFNDFPELATTKIYFGPVN